MALIDAKPCGAKTRSGVPCKNPAMANGRCRLHGGKSLEGIASPRFVTGRYSKHLPARLVERYEAALSDDALLDLKHEVALVDTRIAELLERISAGALGTQWLELREQYEVIVTATRKSDTDAFKSAFDKLGAVISNGADDFDLWQQINDLLDMRRKLVDTERKRLVDMQQMITAEQGVILIRALLGILVEEITDRNVLARLQTRIAGLLARRTGEGSNLD